MKAGSCIKLRGTVQSSSSCSSASSARSDDSDNSVDVPCPSLTFSGHSCLSKVSCHNTVSGYLLSTRQVKFHLCP